jgi:hypothetical protein
MVPVDWRISQHTTCSFKAIQDFSDKDKRPQIKKSVYSYQLAIPRYQVTLTKPVPPLLLNIFRQVEF